MTVKSYIRSYDFVVVVVPGSYGDLRTGISGLMRIAAITLYNHPPVRFEK